MDQAGLPGILRPTICTYILRREGGKERAKWIKIWGIMENGISWLHWPHSDSQGKVIHAQKQVVPICTTSWIQTCKHKSSLKVNVIYLTWLTFHGRQHSGTIILHANTVFRLDLGFYAIWTFLQIIVKDDDGRQDMSGAEKLGLCKGVPLLQDQQTI